MDRGCVIRTVGCGYALESDLLWWNKGSLCDKKTLLLNSWASCCSSRSYACASAFTGQCGMRSARPRQGVAVVGACKEKGGSSPLPLDPSLVFPLHARLVSLRFLWLQARHSFSVRRTVFTAQSYQSHSEWVLHAAYVYASVQTRELVPQHVDKKKLDWTGEDHFLLSWALLNTLSLKT